MTDITIVMTTWLPGGEASLLRAQAIEKALQSWHDNLVHDGAIHLHVADDGSSDAEFDGLATLIGRRWDRGVTTFSRQRRRGLGASLNAGLGVALERSPLILHAVDDWELLTPCALRSWAQLLEEDATVGMVRFFPHPDLSGRVENLGDGRGHVLRLDRHHFAFATRPFLAHRRFFDAYGPFKEGVNAYDCERLYNDGFCHGIPLADGRLMHEARPGVWSPGLGGPDIVLALPSAWEPIGSIELAHIVPEGAP